MGGTGVGTSLLLIASGAVLAFAVDYQTSGVDLNAIGGILLVVGIIGLLFSLLYIGGLGFFGDGRGGVDRTTYIDRTSDHVLMPPPDRIETVERRHETHTASGRDHSHL
jgi:hypothetical protein